MEQSKKLKKRINPLLFFLIIFSISAPFWLLGQFVKYDGLPLNIPVTEIFTTLSPVFATYVFLGKKDFKLLLHRIFDYERIKKKQWYLVIIFFPFIIYLLIYIICSLFQLPLAERWDINFISILKLSFLFFIAAAIEEFAYTGFLLEPMQKKFGAFLAGILIGIPWAIWHYPSMIQQGRNTIWIFWGTIGTIAVRILLVWIYNNTEKSLFACILFHTFLNIGRIIFPTDNNHNPLVDYPYVHYAVISTLTIIIILLWDRETFSKCKLCFPLNRQGNDK